MKLHSGILTLTLATLTVSFSASAGGKVDSCRNVFSAFYQFELSRTGPSVELQNKAWRAGVMGIADPVKNPDPEFIVKEKPQVQAQMSGAFGREIRLYTHRTIPTVAEVDGISALSNGKVRVYSFSAEPVYASEAPKKGETYSIDNVSGIYLRSLLADDPGSEAGIRYQIGNGRSLATYKIKIIDGQAYRVRMSNLIERDAADGSGREQLGSTLGTDLSENLQRLSVNRMFGDQAIGGIFERPAEPKMRTGTNFIGKAILDHEVIAIPGGIKIKLYFSDHIEVYVTGSKKNVEGEVIEFIQVGAGRPYETKDERNVLNAIQSAWEKEVAP